MSQGVFQPVGQKRLTNIAVVRLKKTGKRFEIACYKNKVLDWRQGSEKDIDEVLQTEEVFQNVGKGQVAHTEDLMKAFGTSDRMAICKIILAKGDLQVSEKERQVELGALFRDVASIIVEKCVNPNSQRPYTVGLIERGLKDIHFAVDPSRPAKQQAFEAIPELQKRFPIERALMRVTISLPLSQRAELMSTLQGTVPGAVTTANPTIIYETESTEQPAATIVETAPIVVESAAPSTAGKKKSSGGQHKPAQSGDEAKSAIIEEDDIVGDMYTATALIQPGTFRHLYNFVSQQTGGSGRLDVVAVAAQDAAAPAAANDLSTGADGIGGEGAAVNTSQGGAAGGVYASGGGVAGGFTASVGGSVVMPIAPRAAPEPSGEVLYTKGPVSGIPDTWENRRDMFVEIDKLQEGWTVELRARGGTATGPIDAVFYDPKGTRVGAFSAARRKALQASKAASRE